MYNKQEVIEFLEDTLNAMVKAELFIADMTYEEFLKDEKTIFAVIRAIEVNPVRKDEALYPALSERYSNSDSQLHPRLKRRGFLMG
jgi:hypothetical protein